MSAFDEMVKEGLLTRKEAIVIQKRAKGKITNLKYSSRRIDRAAKRFAMLHRDPRTGRWDNIENKKFFVIAFVNTHFALETRIRRLGGAKKIQDFDPY